MGVELARVDERLIHGQVMTAWVKRFWISRIVLVDDEIAQDDFMKQILAMSAPPGVKVDVKSAADAAAWLAEDGDQDHVMLLFKEISSALALVKQGYAMKELNIGNIGSAPGRSAVTREVYISEPEKAMIRELNENGVHIYIQKLPQDSQINILDKIK